jgi:hypothetical protein
MAASPKKMQEIKYADHHSDENIQVAGIHGNIQYQTAY